ncbi:hypothetical protein HJ01_00537 [Flavobacterium frigoris PS1]|uniref:Uncharacterized protein n=1 Tax=Flavobacterium frigoris (strain PS1) TaxID=1086011 RepID=H7FN63_FLAFP|nr:hypothetical protein HJ01_00537 [Flavobacterium frigoris PS1]
MFDTYEGKFKGLNYFTKMPKGDTKIHENSDCFMTKYFAKLIN